MIYQDPLQKPRHQQLVDSNHLYIVYLVFTYFLCFLLIVINVNKASF